MDYKSLTSWNNSVAYINDNGHVHQTWWGGKNWLHQDITEKTKSPNAEIGSTLTSWNNSICYVDSSSHIHQLWWGGKEWLHQDLTEITSSTTVKSGSRLTSWGNSVCYIDDNNHVNQLWWGGKEWLHQDLTSKTSSPAAGSIEALTSWNNSVCYLDENNHIHQLWWGGKQWLHQDLTLITGSAVVQSGSTITSWNNSVCYLDNNNHIHQLWWGGREWLHQDLTKVTSSPDPRPNSVMTSWNNSVCYQDKSGNIHQLYWGGHGWLHLELTKNPKNQTPGYPTLSSSLKSSLTSWNNSVVYVDAIGGIHQLNYDQDTNWFSRVIRVEFPVLNKHSSKLATTKQIQEAYKHLEEGGLIDKEKQKVITEVEEFLVSNQLIDFDYKVNRRTGEPQSLDCGLAIGVVVVDVIFLVVSFVGIYVQLDDFAKRAAAKAIGQEVTKNQAKWEKLVNGLIKSQSVEDKAKAIFGIASAAYTAGMFRGILEEIKDSMSWWDWAITAVASVAQIIALMATGGTAFVAELVGSATSLGYVVSDSFKIKDACK